MTEANDATFLTLDQRDRQLIEQSKQRMMARMLYAIAQQLDLPASSTHGTLKQITSNLYDVVKVFTLIEQGADLETVRQAVEIVQTAKIIDQLSLQLQSVNDQSGRIQKLIRAIYKFSKEGEHVEVIHLNRIVEDTLKLIHSCLNAGQQTQRIQIFKQYDPNLPEIVGCLSSLRQMIFSLIDFAISRLQSFDLQRSTQGRPIPRNRITITSLKLDQAVGLIIADTGPRLSEGEFQQMLHPSADEATNLAISYSIIQMHKGLIQYAKNQQRGAEILVTLPLHPNSTSSNANP